MKPTPLLLIGLTELPPSTPLRNVVFGDSRWLSLGLALGFFCLNATAATVVVTAQNFSFSPSAVTIAVGDSVSFNNAGGDHNVTGYNPAPPPERFCGTALLGIGPMCTVTFTNAGVFQFRCVPHSSGSGASFSGMIGSITVTSPPAIAAVVPGQSYLLPGASLTLSVTNPPSVPSTYQWQFNGINLPGATGPTLALSNVTTNNTGSYRVTVSNAFAVVTIAAAAVQVVDRVTITAQPKSISVLPGTNVTFSVAVLSPLPITYQWQLNGTNLPGATSATLSITNAQFDPHTGYYRVLTSDTASSALTETASLVVVTRPVIVNQPTPQSVLEGGTAVLGVIAAPDHPLLPLNYRWLRSATTYVAQGQSTLTVSNLQTNTPFRVVVTNLAGLIASATVTVTVLADNDRDGMADEWETLNGFDSANAADATLDSDGDDLRNRDEYAAGTDPRDPSSRLKIESLTRTGSNSVVLQFHTVSNRTYIVQFSSEASGVAWTNLAGFDARTTNATEWLTNLIPNSATRGFYRVVTPRQP